MFEKSAVGDDIRTCPRCNSNEGLVIRWHPDIDHRVHEYTEVGCKNCNIFFQGEEDRFPITEWNLFVIEENKKKGVNDENEELYQLLHAHHLNEKNEAASRRKIDEYLEKHISPICPFKKGERFVFRGHKNGVWSAQSVHSVYGTNTGPFWILTAQKVNKNGSLSEAKMDFWQRDIDLMRPIAPYWKASKWAQVIAGDKCLIGRDEGVITEVNREKHIAKVEIDRNLIEIRKLNEIKVEISRVESNGT